MESTSSKVVKDTRLEEINSAYELLSTGKKCLIANDIAYAVSSLSEACQLLSKQFGETAAECAEAYFYYGKALLEVSRMETMVLENALEGVDIDGEVSEVGSEQVEDPAKLSVDEVSDIMEKVELALDENFERHDKFAKVHSIEDQETESEDSDVEDCGQDEESPEIKAKPTVEEIDGEDVEDVGDLQLAWEMLELAKIVFIKTVQSCTNEDQKKKIEQKICDAFLCLGEISLENENYSQAIEDFTTCLNKRKTCLPAESRSIAETHYQLGVSLAYHGKYQAAEASLNSAIVVLETRIANLKKIESSDNIADEIAELEEAIAGIKERIIDYKEVEKEAVNIKKCEKTGFTNVSVEGKVAFNIAVKKDLSKAKPMGTPTTPCA